MAETAYLSEIVVEGSKRTKLVYFQRVLADAGVTTKSVSLSLPYASTTKLSRSKEPIPVEQLQRKAEQAVQLLRGSGLFEEVDAKFELRKVRRDNVPEATVVISVKEKGIPYLSVQSYVKTNSTIGAELRGALRSPFGYGETFKISGIQSNSVSNVPEFSVGAEIPHLGMTLGALSFNARIGRERQSCFSSYDQDMKTVMLDYATPDQMHSFSLECSLRDEIPILSTAESKGLVDLVQKAEPRTASATILSNVAASWKLSLKHVGTFFDDRDNKINPSCGSLLQTTTEIALPPGQAQFIKSEISSQHHLEVSPRIFEQPGLVLSMANTLGLMVPLNSGSNDRERMSYLSDRFYVGGPLSLRGFMPGGIGPRAYSVLSDDSLGGDSKAQCLCMASYPVPFKGAAQAGLRVFGFLNAGSLGSSRYWQQPQTLQPSYPLFGYPRVSVGLGFSVGFGNLIRLEATYALPILKEQNDNTKRFQIGVGVTIG